MQGHRRGRRTCLAAIVLLTIAATDVAAGEPPAEPILRIETGTHTATITDLAVAPDGLVATVSEDKTLRLWQPSDGAPVATIRPPIAPGVDGLLNAAAFAYSPNGRFLLAGGLSGQSWDNTNWLYVIDSVSGKIVFQTTLAAAVVGLDVHVVGDVPRNVAIALANAARGTFGVRVTNRSLQTMYEVALEARPAAAKFAADGRLVVATDDGSLQVFGRAETDPGEPDLLASSQISSPSAEQLAPRVVSVHPDSEVFAVGYRNARFVDVFRTGDLSLVGRLRLGLDDGTPQINALAWVDEGPDGVTLWAGGGLASPNGKRVVRRWPDASDARLYDDVEVSDDAITVLTPAPGGGVFFAASDPVWGAIRPDASISFVNTAPGNDHRELFAKGFAVAADAAQISFRETHGADTRWTTFDASKLLLVERGPTATFAQPLPPPDLDDWQNHREPTYRGQPLTLAPGEFARSADSLPDGRFVIGADYSVYLFGADGDLLMRQPVDSPAFGVVVDPTGKRLVVAFGDGSLRWLSLAEGAELDELGTLFVAEGDRWVAWLPDGRFAASANGGTELVGYHLNRSANEAAEFVDFGQLFEQMYAPDAIRAALGADSIAAERLVDDDATSAQQLLATIERPTVEVAGLCFDGARGPDGCMEAVRLTRAVRRAPTGAPAASFNLPEGVQDVRIRFRVQMDGEPEGINVFVNGQTVGLVTRGVSRARIGAEETWQIFERPLRVGPGENRIRVRVAGADGVYGKSEEIVVTARPAAREERTLHVLAVGTNDYRGEIPRLASAEADAIDLGDILERYGEQAYDAVSVRSLVADQVTRDGTLEAIAEIAAVVEPIDSVVIYFAGHGRMEEDRYHFLPIDVIRRSEVASHGLSEADILDSVSAIRAENIMIALDTCHAGGFPSEIGGRLRHQSGYYVLAASAEVEEALDTIGDNGAFMTAFKEATLGGEAALRSGVVTAWNVGGYIQQRVAELAAERAHRQEAQFLAEARGEFALMEVPAEAPAEATAACAEADAGACIR
ncbi:MAG: caspase family protein [Pseudomonadota bacterium]